MCLKSIISNCIEIGLSITEQGNVGPRQPHLRIAIDLAELFRIIGKGNILLEQIHFRDYA
jgi:hypothetical protein